MAKVITTKGGEEFIVDDEDFDIVSKYKWMAVKTKYTAYARSTLTKMHPVRIRMHRLIMNPPDGMDVDHIDGNGRNNQRSNLRICTRAENQWHQRIWDNNAKSGKTSRFKGVHWASKEKRWSAVCTKGKKTIHVGRFKSEIEAALAYNTKAIELYGEFATLNTI